MTGPSDVERRRYNVGVRKVPYEQRDLAHRVLTDDDPRGFLDIMGADTPDQDATFPIGSSTTYSVELTTAEVDEFRAASNVRYVEEDTGARAAAVPSAATLSYLEASFSGSDVWHGRDVPIAVCDSGTTTAVRNVMGWTLLGRQTFGAATNPAPAEVWNDGSNHGCKAAATSVPAGGQFYDLLITGADAIAPLSTMAASMVFAADLGVKIVHMSYGYAGQFAYDQAVRDAIDYCYARDVQIYAPVGNDSSTSLWYPASYCTTYDNVHAVINFNQATDTRYTTSNHSDAATGCAPGVNVTTLNTAGAEITWTGTSAAAAHATLLCARGSTGGRSPKVVAAALRRHLRNTGQPASEQGGGAFSLQRAIPDLQADTGGAPIPTDNGGDGGPVTDGVAWPTTPVLHRRLSLVNPETVTVVSAMSGTGLPTWEIDTIKIINGSCIDSLGRQWTVGKHPDGEKGWSTPAGPRTNRSDRPDGDGSYRSRSYRKERLITLSGSVLCPTPELRERTEMELASLCSDGGRLYTYRRTTEAYDHVTSVELDDDPLIDMINIYRIDWSFRFAAPDPRKHDYAWQEPRMSPASDNAPVGGLDDSGGGLTDTPGGGLDAGTPSDPVLAQVANYGTATASPVFLLVGPQPPCSILRDETGERVDYLAGLAAGEFVMINCDEFTARGVPPRTALSNLNGDVTAWLVVSDWPTVEPQDVATFRLLGSGPPDSATAALRSAWR